ncbi:MAG: DUF4129 domain-containing protein [Bacteroidetes bacterium]|nr:MAG: DUF4129 domain-containing protein [Bacteroidota bacterium]
MRYSIIRILILVWAGWLPAFQLAAQADSAATTRRPVPESGWEEASGDLDYSLDVPEAPRETEEPETGTDSSAGLPSPTFDTGWLGNIAQVLAILLAIAAIGYGIYRMLEQPSNKRIARDGAEITVDNLETYLHETDLERFLREALEREDYTQAIRIYFLQVIKRLSQAGAIQWSQEKTNRDYLRDMRPDPDFQAFQQLTFLFERIWYGNQPVGAADFSRLEPDFKYFLQRRSVSADIVG